MSKKSKDAAIALKQARKKQKLPKQKCCVSRPRCKRCPLRMLAEGTLPAGYAVRHRKLVEFGELAAEKTEKKAKQTKKDAKKRKRNKKRTTTGTDTIPANTDTCRRAA